MTLDSTSEAPEPSPPTFASMGLTQDVQRALDEIGYEHPTPVQQATYKPAVDGTDIIVQARTGTGKTAAFGIPLVDRIVNKGKGVQALVLAPTRELALQSAREIARLGKHRDVRTVAVYGGAPMAPQIRELADGAQIVSGTPGRVLDHLRRGTLDPSGLRVLVLDEMDEMLSMGFAKELGAILELIPDETKRQTMCFSATVDGAVRRHALRHMRDPQLVFLSSDAVGAEQVTHSVYMVTGTNRTGDLIQILNVEDPETAIIFCNLRSETERVAAELQRAGFNADWLNGDLPQRDRERIMARTREGKLRYLVATDVAARGIDVSHLTHVINYSFPEAAATYVHRTGRTGRAGRTGAAISLVSPQELGRLYYLRLEYKITPIERSLPTAGEHRTRQELDRLKLLEDSLEHSPSAADLALARRLLTHPNAERILGGLLGAFFGGEERDKSVDEDAARSRRDRRPAQTSPRARSRSRGDHRWGKAVGASNEGSDSASPPMPPEGGGTSALKVPDEPRASRGRRRSRRRRRKVESPEEFGVREQASAGDTTQGPTAAQAQVEPVADPAARVDAEPDSSVHTLRDVDAEVEFGFVPDEGRPGATVFLKVGRRDGARVGEIVRLMRDTCDLEPQDVGRVRMRDRYTYVDVPEQVVDAVVERLEDVSLHDRPLSPERARVSRS